LAGKTVNRWPAGVRRLADLNFALKGQIDHFEFALKGRLIGLNLL
jgi:hypothetical protein